MTDHGYASQSEQEAYDNWCHPITRAKIWTAQAQEAARAAFAAGWYAQTTQVTDVMGLLAIKELLEEADQYRHPDFDSDCEKLVVRLADELLAALSRC